MRVCSLSSFPPPIPAPLCLPTASISSIKIKQGLFSLALLKRSLTHLHLHQQTFQQIQNLIMRRMVHPLLQLLLLLIGFPVPGGPTNNTPLGILAPTEVNFSGFFRKVTTSCKSCLASLTPQHRRKQLQFQLPLQILLLSFQIASAGPPGIPFDLLANKIKPPIRTAGKVITKIPKAGGAVLIGCTSNLFPHFLNYL